MSPQQKATPGENSGGRTLLSVTQVSGLPARPPSLPERRKDNPEIPPGVLVGLGQSHLSQKIPAATTRCVYLDHLLSRAVNSAKCTTRLCVPQGKYSRIISFFEAEAKEVEGPVGAPLPDGLPRTRPGREVQPLRESPLRVREPHEDEPDGLLLRPAVGSGYPCDREAVIRAGELAYTLGHRAGDGLRDG